MKNKILLLKSFLCAAGIVLLMSGDAHADLVINFSDMDAREGTVDVGTLGAITEPADQAAITSLVYTVTGLTIDAVGTADDQITVTIPISAIGPGTNTIDWDTGAPEFDFNDAVFRNAGEGISFGAIGVTGVLSGGAPLVVNSAEYTEWSFRRWGNGEVVTVAGDVTNDTWEQAAPASDPTNVPLNDTFFSLTHVSGGTWNGNDVSFAIDVACSTAVPEPSTMTMFGLAIAGLFTRRRRA